MDIFGKYKSPLGYTLGGNNVDSYGVDHSGFTTRDEVAYQTARQQRENQIMQNYNGQGINQDYPQYGTDFWGHSSENNYGFGASQISPNIENIQNTPVPNVQNQVQTKANNIPRYWDTAADGEKVWNYVQQQEGDIKPQRQNMLGYGASGVIGGVKTLYNYLRLQPKSYTDKYKHAVINCSASQSGEAGYDLANAFSNFKEDRDISSGGNTLDSSQADQYANKIGRLLGTKYPNGDCDEIVQRYINKRW